MSWLTRHAKKVSLTIAKSAALSDEFEMTRFAMVLVHMPAAWTSASLGFKVASATGGTFQPLYNDNGVLVQIDSPAASKSYVAPAELAATDYVKLWSQNGSGTNTTQGTARTIVVTLKT